jgi:putative serine protease PepD
VGAAQPTAGRDTWGTTAGARSPRERAQVASTRVESGPFSFGDNPDDADGPENEDLRHRGWIAPEDRLWRHPSEISDTSGGLLATSTARPSSRDLWRERRGAIAAGTLGAAAVAAAAAVVLTLVDAPAGSASRPLPATETSLFTIPSVSVSAAPGIMEVVSALRPSLVELMPTGDSSRGPATGVVLPGGDFVVTAASAATGVSRVEVVTSTGRHMRGKVIAIDERSGVAVVSTSGGLVPASFGNDDDVVPGEWAITASLSSGPASSSAPATEVAVGMVRQVGHGVSSGRTTGLMDAIEADTSIRADRGGVLLDGRGEVIGILDGQENASAGPVGLFVPASLALGVADELVSDHRVDHGWIGVNVTDAAGGTGAEVTSVFPNSPAAGAGIAPGDVITAIDTHDVKSEADLQAFLYTLPPGSTVELAVERAGVTRNVSTALAADPGN